MATFYSGYSNQYRLRLEVTQKSQDVNKNTSTVDWALYLENGISYFQQYGTQVTVSLGGESVHNSNIQRSVYGMNTTTLSESGTKTINHNADGSKRLAVYALLETNTKDSLTPSSALVINSSMSLTTIPRASKPTLSSGSVNFGDTVTINTNVKSNLYELDTLELFEKLNVGDKKGTVIVSEDAGAGSDHIRSDSLGISKIKVGDILKHGSNYYEVTSFVGTKVYIKPNVKSNLYKLDKLELFENGKVKITKETKKILISYNTKTIKDPNKWED